MFNKLHNVVLRYRFFSLGQTDPFYCKTLISSAKNSVQIACAQLIELTFTFHESRDLLLPELC